MEVLVQDNLYFILIAVGALVVAIHACSLYDTALSDQILRVSGGTFKVRDLCSKPRYETGRLAYLTPILLVYLLLAVSPELLTLSMGIAGTTSSVGALSLSNSEAQTLSPILAATAVVALLGIRQISGLERSLRSICHGIAGIPQHFQEIVSGIQCMDLRKITPENTLGDKRASSRWRMPMLGNDIKAIQVFHKWIFGNIGNDLWTARSAYLIEQEKLQLSGEYNYFLQKLASREEEIATIDRDDTDRLIDDRADDEQRDIVTLARHLRLQYSQLLAIAISNEHRRQKPEATPAILWELVLDVRASLAESRLMGVLASSTLFSFVIALLFTTLVYLTLAVTANLAPENLSLDESESHLLVNGAPMGSFYLSTLTSAFNTALWDVSGLCLILLFGCGTGVAYRASKVRGHVWAYWHREGYPILQYAKVIILATVVASFPYVLFLFVKLVAWPSAMFAVPALFASMLRDFANSYLEFGFLCLLAAPAAVLICLLSDRLEQRRSDVHVRDSSTLKLIALSALGAGTLVPLLVRMQIGDVEYPRATILATALPVATLAMLAGSFWEKGFGQVRPEADVKHHWPRVRPSDSNFSEEPLTERDKPMPEPVESSARDTLTERNADA